MRYLAQILLLVIFFSGSVTTAHAVQKEILLAGGCFWCVESDFDKLDGVTETTSGYAGGSTQNPTYETYTTGEVSHIEVVKMTYDTDKISYSELLDYFFHHIDPTDGEGQFCDRGAAYRPAIFVKNDHQRKTAQKIKQHVADQLNQPVKVDILQDAKFWPAEEYHQDYYRKNPIRYKFYRWNCGRDQKIDALWTQPQRKDTK